MKGSELQIGDWVQGFVPDSYSRIYGIFNEYRISVIAEPIKAYIELSVDEVQPIPLTPEILEKNGFKRIEGNRFYPNPRWVFAQDGSRDGVVIEIVLYEQPINGVNILTKINTQSSKDYGVNDFHNCDIEYVHQLQQALRLCKIDKEITVC